MASICSISPAYHLTPHPKSTEKQIREFEITNRLGFQKFYVMQKTTIQNIENLKSQTAWLPLSKVLYDVKKIFSLFPRGLHLPTLHITVPENFSCCRKIFMTTFYISDVAKEQHKDSTN